MTPEETELLALVGSATLFSLTACSLEFLFWGIHAVLSVAGLVSLWRRGLKARPAQFLFVTLAAVLVLNTFATTAYFAIAVRLIQMRFIRHPDLPFEERVALASEISISPLSNASEYLANVSGLIYIIGDGVILWRAWKIWMGPRIILVVPTFLVFATFAFSLTSTTVGIKLVGPQDNASLFGITCITAETCSLAANLVTTSMIGAQVYQHRERMKEAFGDYTSRHWRIMLFLTEAGVVYLIIQAVEMALSLSTTVAFSPLAYASKNWLTFARHVSASYPAIVVLMTQYNHSLANDSVISGPASDIGTNLSFARSRVNGTVSDTTSATDRELSSHHLHTGGVTSHSDRSHDAKATYGDQEKTLALA